MLDCAKFPQDNDMCITAQSVRQGSGSSSGSSSGKTGAGKTRGESPFWSGNLIPDLVLILNKHSMCSTVVKHFSERKEEEPDFV